MRFFSAVFSIHLCIAVSAVAQPIVVDRHSVQLFDFIPEQYRDAASRLRLLFMNRSVGGNIDEGLSCLSFEHRDAPNHCKRWEHGGTPPCSVDASEVYWPGRWDRSNWEYEFWPDGCNHWYGSVQCFVNSVESRIEVYDVLGYQFSYLEVSSGSNIADPVDGFFGSRTDRGTASTYAAFAARHPDKTVIWWTTSLARGIGTPESEAFNEAMRQYTRANDFVLFDVADILSHTPDGYPCYDNRDGVEYRFGNNSENHPDDGLDIPAICQEYTTEVNGGHLGAVSAGKIRVVKAFWVLMARIAGWDGSIGTDTTRLPDAPLLLTPFHGAVVEADEVTFRWRAAAPNITKYRIDIARDPGFDLMLYSDSLLVDTTTTVSTLPRDVVCYWRVGAGNSAGWGAPSVPWSVVLGETPPFFAMPITEMGRSLYKEFPGGLYPDATNSRPVQHDEAGRRIGNAILPLDSLGNPDVENGRIVLLSIGMSNTGQEFTAFEAVVDTFDQKHPKLVTVNGAQAGQTASVIRHPDAEFWRVLENERLYRKRVAREQVQVVWLKQANSSPRDPFPTHAISLQQDIRAIVRLLPEKFPNIKIAYISSRIYGGYATGPLNPEPYAYESGFSVRWLVGAQIEGDTALDYNATPPRAPWLSWGPYLWANGMHARQDGLQWFREDFAQDGTHPSEQGRYKVARLLLDFFSTDESAMPWFLRDSPTGMPSSPIIDELRFSVSPNPVRDNFVLHYCVPAGSRVQFDLYSILGHHIATLHSGWASAGNNTVPVSVSARELPAGTYFIRISTPYGIRNRTILLLR